MPDWCKFDRLNFIHKQIKQTEILLSEMDINIIMIPYIHSNHVSTIQTICKFFYIDSSLKFNCRILKLTFHSVLIQCDSSTAVEM